MSASVPFHVMAKPAGPACNLDCRYCFYLEKSALFPAGRTVMDDELLERYVAQQCAAQPGEAVQFAWQGGEPTLLGVDWFARAVELQRRHAGGRRVLNVIQTNAVLLDDAWCAFLARERFLVGVSIDGPAALHDRYRVDRKRRPTHARVVAAIARLRDHGVDFNTLTVVNRVNGSHALEVYGHLAALGSTFMQFIPLVERRPRRGAKGALCGPPDLASARPGAAEVTAWSVRARQFGTFLTTIYDRWVRHDVGRVHVQAFETLVGQWLGAPADVCVFAERCGRALALEHDGGVYACDHYVYPEYRLGNLRDDDLASLVELPAQAHFGAQKSAALPGHCRRCEVRRFCHGGCPKQRFLATPGGESGLNYLCAGYAAFFRHVAPTMRVIRDLVAAGRPAAGVMAMLGGEPRPAGRV